MKQTLTIIVTALITALITTGGLYLWQTTECPQKSPEAAFVTSDWLTYESENGFSFMYPPGYDVSENTDPENPDITNVFIAGAEGPPVLQMNVSDYSVSFSLWEGAPWKGYPEIVNTFKKN